MDRPIDLYPLLVFLHVLGAVALFAALGIEVVGFRRLQGAVTVDQARTWMGLLREPGRIGRVSMVTILVAGLWMMALRWGPEPWILTALGGVIVMAILAGGLTRRVMARLGTSLAAGPDQLPADFPPLITGMSLAVSLWLRVAVAVGILGLMTVKPGVLGSLAIMAAATAIGIGAAARASRDRRGQRPRRSHAPGQAAALRGGLPPPAR